MQKKWQTKLKWLGAALRYQPVANRARSRSLFAFVLVGFFFFQLGNFLSRNDLPVRYPLKDIIGMHGYVYQEFSYYLYYFGVFPVAMEAGPPLATSFEQAEEQIKIHGKNLRMDRELGTAKWGDYARVFLFFPEAWSSGPHKATIRTANRLFFVLALLSVLIGFWVAGQRELAICLVLILGSNPFYTEQAWKQNNIFSYSISAFLLLMGLFAGLLLGRPIRKWHGFAAVFAGILLGTLAHIRSEATLVILSCATAFVLARGSWLSRFGLCAVLFLSFYGQKKALNAYFDDKFVQAQQFVSAHGGLAFEGRRMPHHVLWHSLYCGFGDFDTKYGFEWKDAVVYAYGIPKVKEKYGLDLHWSEGGYLDSSYDSRGYYRKQPEDFTEYEQVIKEKVLSTITSDPIWYLGILAQRAWAVLTVSVPPGLAWGKWWMPIPFPVWIAFLVSLGWALARNTFALKLGLFTLPLAAIPLFVHAGHGFTYFGIFHQVVLACVLAFFWNSRRRHV